MMKNVDSISNLFVLIKDHVDKIDFSISYDVPETEDLKLVAMDVGTGLMRDQLKLNGYRKSDGFNYWWSPGPSNFNSPDKLNLGDIILQLRHNNNVINEFYLDRGGPGSKILINNTEVFYPKINDPLYLIYWEIFINKEYENIGDIDENGLIIDIGSNYGFFSLYAINKYKPRKIVGVEPNFHAFSTSKKVLSEFKSFLPLNYAITKETGYYELINDSISSSLGKIVAKDNGNIMGVDINSLFDTLQEPVIDLIKIDCEGGELEIFQSISDENLNKIKNLVVEYHSHEIRDFIYDKLKSLNFYLSLDNKESEIGILIAKKELKKPKIRVVHLLLDPNERKDIPEESWKSTIDKQNFSISCWENMKDMFFDYVQRYSIVNREDLPVHNCMEPQIINNSKELKQVPPSLSYGHYGAYKAHVNGILENFSEDIDALIIAEGDSYTHLSPEEFYSKVAESYELAQKIDARLISYAGPCYMTGDLSKYFSFEKYRGDWISVSHFLMGTTYMITKSDRENIINDIHNTGWHSPDLWLAWNYDGRGTVMVSSDKLVHQKNGYSLLDHEIVAK